MALTSNVPDLTGVENITGDWVNTTNPWADNEVADALTISGGTVNSSVIGGTTAAAGTFTTLTSNAGVAVKNGVSAATIEVYEASGDGTEKVTLQSQAMSSDYTLTLPTDAGTSGQVLSTDGSGNLSWATDGAGLDADTALSNLASVAINASLISDTDDTDDLGSSSNEWKDLYIDGTANIDSLIADTADINGGTIDGATVGANSANTGAFTTLQASSTTTLNAGVAVKNGASAGTIEIFEASGDGTEKVTLQSQSMAASYTLTLPTDDGTSGQVLSTNGSGSLSWADDASGVGTSVDSSEIIDNEIVNADINSSAAIADTKLATISTSGKVSNSATTATNANTASAIVARDGSGNFSAGTGTFSGLTVSGTAGVTGVTTLSDHLDFAAGKDIRDANDNELLAFPDSAVGSAVNEITIANATTGSGPTISSSGGDTDVDLNLDAKGTGVVNVNTSRVTNVADPTSNQDAATKAYADTKASLASPTFTGTVSTDAITASGIVTLNGTMAGTAFKDEDNMSSDSAVALASQQSIKAYVDANGGAFSTTSNVTSNSGGTLADDDFVFGSSKLADDDDTDHDARFFFDKSKGAFRAGKVKDDKWDASNVGSYSFASGSSTKASGMFSTAMGSSTIASGQKSTAMGSSTEASGSSSTAMGRNTTAESYAEVTIGQYNTDYTPVGTTSWNSADRVFVIGNGTYSVKSDALIVYKNGDATLAGTLTQNSDRRLKININNLDYGLEEVMQLHPVSFNWKKNPDANERLGLVAQEVQEVVKEVVHEGSDPDKLLSISYSSLIPVLIKAMQEQQEQIEYLKKQVADKK